MDVGYVGLCFHRVLSTVVALVLAMSPCLRYAGSLQEQLGVLLEFEWNVGVVQP